MIILSQEDIEQIRNDFDPSKFLHSPFFEDYIVPEDFIRELYNRSPSKIPWGDWFEDISLNQNLSEDFIREFQDKLEWRLISSWQKLSESFIQEFSHKLNWRRISTKQRLSKEFIAKNLDKLYLNELLDNKLISNEVKTYIRMFI